MTKETTAGAQAKVDAAVAAALVSPALTGTPTAPTATAGTNTTQVATTAFVTTAITNNGASGRELAYAESETAQTGIAGTETDLTGLSITFDVGARPVYVILDLALLFPVTNTAIAYCKITDAANVLKRGKTKGLASTTITGESCLVVERIAVPGTYTRKARIQRSGGTGTISHGAAGLGIYSTIRAVEA